MLTHDRLAQGLLAALRAQEFTAVIDPLDGGRPLRQPPSIDLAVVAFPRDAEPVAANVLLSRDHPDGLVAPLPADGGPQQQIGYLADLQDDSGLSIAWQPGADWDALPWKRLHGSGPRFVAPYPASLLKLMLAVGVARFADLDRLTLDERWAYQGQVRPVRAWVFDMLAVSCNRSTSALVALAHARALLDDEARGPHALHRLFAELELPTLRVAGTQPDGGWGNAAGAGVGRIQMTAWDSVRLLWWLEAGHDTPAPRWRGAQAWRLSPGSRAALLEGLTGQGLDVVLSSSALAGVPGWRPGIPNALHGAWRRPDGGAQVGDYEFPPLPPLPPPELQFAHKIGSTENYASDAGIVRGLAPWRRHYLVAMQSNLGKRYAPHPVCAGPWALPALGAAIDALLKKELEA